MPPTTDPKATTNRNTKKHSEIYEKHSELFMILAVVFLFTSVIMALISIALSWKLCCQKRKEGAILLIVCI